MLVECVQAHKNHGFRQGSHDACGWTRKIIRRSLGQWPGRSESHDDQPGEQSEHKNNKKKSSDHPKIQKSPKNPSISPTKCKLRQTMAVRVHSHCLHNADTARGSLDGLGSNRSRKHEATHGESSGLRAVKGSDMSGDGHLHRWQTFKVIWGVS